MAWPLVAHRRLLATAIGALTPLEPRAASTCGSTGHATCPNQQILDAGRP
jgi:hypothetical protein